ncbi:U box domain containing protein [Klebsormidium nitens]|uniref:U box domain containing protein n=1 Tax=Klebsormidium nitens TaxID=105231 RepID=A0A1Y1IE86_KLENI|nr:U box domain containing protein [Klebsormidium nitens]|eukprot:GAQ87719.1 U box domain containing protein [Klebsormidium nitens]
MDRGYSLWVMDPGFAKFGLVCKKVMSGGVQSICASCDHPLAAHKVEKPSDLLSGSYFMEYKERELQLKEREMQLKEREVQLKERAADLENRAAKRHKLSHPDAFVCPITKALMSDPVMLVETGKTFERAAIEEWLATHDTCPIERSKKLQKKDVLPVESLSRAIKEWRG